MTIANTARMRRRPAHPGEMLREDFMPNWGLSVFALAEAAGVSRQSSSELLCRRRAVSPEMAFRLSCLFGYSATGSIRSAPWTCGTQNRASRTM
jgi:antitoxin HigA-1